MSVTKGMWPLNTAPIIFFLDPIETDSPSPLASPIPRNYSESASHLDSLWPAIIGGSIGFTFLLVAIVILIILLSICTVLARQRKNEAESSPQRNVKGVCHAAFTLCMQVRESE